MMIHDDATDDDDDLRQGSAIRAVEQPFKFAARRGDWDDCLVAFSDLINIIMIDLDKYDRDGDDVEDGVDLSSDNARSGCNAVKLNASAGQYKCLLFPPCLVAIIMRFVILPLFLFLSLSFSFLLSLSLSLSSMTMFENTCETTINCLGETNPPAPATVTCRC